MRMIGATGTEAFFNPGCVTPPILIGAGQRDTGGEMFGRWRAPLIPCRRQTSAVAIPASCSFTIAMICSSDNLLRFLRPSPRETDSLPKNGANSGVHVTRLSGQAR